MTYIDGFVLAVPTANNTSSSNTPTSATPLSWITARSGYFNAGDNVPEGKTTDFFGAVESRDDEWSCSAGSNGPARPPARR